MNRKGHQILGKKVEFKLAFSKEDSYQNLRQIKERKILFKNVRKNTDSDSVVKYFEQFGMVIDFRIIYPGNSNKQTFGFVTFLDKYSVEKVINAGLNHYIEKIDRIVNN